MKQHIISLILGTALLAGCANFLEPLPNGSYNEKNYADYPALVRGYVEKAYDSICSQTLTNWEMFLVDDGSTDGTSEICDILASDDSRIHVIHQENQGAAGARNAAIENATGKYLYFLDFYLDQRYPKIERDIFFPLF